MKHAQRWMAVLLALALLLSLTGCDARKDEGKVALTMYLWDRPMAQALPPWLEKQFPDIDFTFVVGYNTMDFYTDLHERGALPDIITCRRFSLNDAAHLSEMLLDLRETDVVGSYYDSYIEYNREPDGAIRWLPTCAEVDGYIANVDLFERCGIPLPTNYAEFADACRRFEELGLRGYLNDYWFDYSCMEALQGNAISQLMSLEGMQWRMAYENATDDAPVGLDDTVWPAVFERFAQYLKDTDVLAEHTQVKYPQMRDAFLAGEVAIIRGTANDCVLLREMSGFHTVMLPYFGDTAEDSWLLTYPVFQVAVNKQVSEDGRKQDAVMRVLGAMLSEEGQRQTAVTNAVLSYNKNVNIPINDVFSQAMDCIERNHLYIRLASTKMFSVSRDVVQKMIFGEYTAEEACQAAHAQLIAGKSVEQPEIITTQEKAYAYADGKGGHPAASAVMNTLRKATQSDLAVGFSSLVTAPVFAGAYTEQQLNWLLVSRLGMRKGTLTGAEVRTLMQWLVNPQQDGANPIRHSNLIPVSSGMAYQVTAHQDGTYTLGEITVGGKPLDDAAEYTVLTVGDEYFITSASFCNAPMPEVLEEKLAVVDEHPNTLFQEALAGGNQMEAPENYLTVKHEK
ncbi:MAG: extracellular solute-binding protein [Clostridiales bacterium]|nr:extracellular solute-binding protein [Clostridiales bacterium]